MTYEKVLLKQYYFNVLLAAVILTVCCLTHNNNLCITYNMGNICIFKKYFGICCPGCGGTRAVISFLNGYYIDSIKYNVVVVLGVVMCILLCIINTCILLFNINNRNLKINVISFNKIYTIIIFTAIFQFIYKNILILNKL